MSDLLKAAELLPCPFCGYELPLDEGLCKADDGINPDSGIREHPSMIACANCACAVVGGDTDEEAIEAWNSRKYIAAHKEQEPVAWSVEVSKVSASNGTTWVVVLNHPLRPSDAKPWDYEGRVELYSFNEKEHAAQTAKEVEAALNCYSLYTHPSPQVELSAAECSAMQAALLSSVKILNKPQVNLSAPVKFMAEQMQRKLDDNSHKTGWGNDLNADLLRRIHDEFNELGVAVMLKDQQQIINEAADVANFAMMIADNARAILKKAGGQ